MAISPSSTTATSPMSTQLRRLAGEKGRVGMKIDPKTLTKDDVGMKLWTKGESIIDVDVMDHSFDIWAYDFLVIYDYHDKCVLLLDMDLRDRTPKDAANPRTILHCAASKPSHYKHRTFYTTEEEAIEDEIACEEADIRRIQRNIAVARDVLAKRAIAKAALDKETTEA